MLAAKPDPIPLTQLFQTAAVTLAEIHQQFRWAIENENQLISLFVVLEKVASALYQKRVEAGGTKQLGGPAAKLAASDDDMEIIEDSDGDDEFEVVEEDDEFEVL